MGRVYTATGIGVNFGGTTVPSTNLLLLQAGTLESAIYVSGGGLTIESPDLGGTILLENDNGKIRIYAGEGTVEITMGSSTNTGMVRFLASSAGGTRAELDANGNLRIAGTIGTGITF